MGLLILRAVPTLLRRLFAYEHPGIFLPCVSLGFESSLRIPPSKMARLKE